MGKTFGPLQDRRTGNHMKNPSFTGPPKFLQDLIFFNIRIPRERLPTGIFFIGLEDRHDSTPEGRAAEPEGRAVSVTRELDLSLLCRI